MSKISDYSVFNAFAGSAVAAFQLLMTTTPMVTASTATRARANTHQYIGQRCANVARYLSTMTQLIGAATAKHTRTIFTNRLQNIARISWTVAPFTLRRAISLRRYCVSNITRPNTPISEMMIAIRVKRLMRCERAFSFLYVESIFSSKKYGRD